MMEVIILIAVISVNVVTFLLFAIDKLCAKLNYWRISERMLFTTIIFGGAVGALLSMRLFHHKTRKKSFVITTYIALVLQLSLIIVGLTFIE